MPILEANVDVLNEVYFGDSILQKAQSLLTKFRSKYIGKPYTRNVNLDPDLGNFNRELEKIFGFYRVSLTIDPIPAYNAGTYPLGIRANVSEKQAGDFTQKVRYTKDRNGFKYSKDTKFVAIIIMFYGVFSDERITDREIMALLLHEVGHNFSRSFIEGGGVYGLMDRVFISIRGIYGKLYEILGNQRLGAGFNNDVAIRYADMQREMQKSEPEINAGFDKIDKLIYKENSIMMNISYLLLPVVTVIKGALIYINPLFNGAITVLRAIGGYLSKHKFGYKDEKFSDMFASMYGYGKELSDVFLKMEEYRMGISSLQKIGSSTISGILFDFMSMPTEILSSLSDPHPAALARIKSQMKYLQKELENADLDPLMKKELKEQYNHLVDSVEDFINIDNRKDGLLLRRMYNRLLYKKFNGDYRELFSGDKALFKYADDISDNIQVEEFTLLDMADPNYIDLEL